jgi:predicted transcriptional regulator
VTRDFLAERLGQEKLRIARQAISDVSEDRRPATRRNLEQIAAVAEHTQGRLDE